MANVKMDWKDEIKLLGEPFDKDDIEWRVQQGGFSEKSGPWVMVMAYITNRAIQKRLDDIYGPCRWKNEFMCGPAGGVLCGISIYDSALGEWVTKYDGAENTDIEGVKGGLSSSMKRAAAQWGIGRYLYRLDVCFARCSESKSSGWRKHCDKKSKKIFYWEEPDLPSWALPKPYLSKDSLNWDAACESIMKGEVTVDRTCDSYNVSTEDRSYLLGIYNTKEEKNL